MPQEWWCGFAGAVQRNCTSAKLRAPFYKLRGGNHGPGLERRAGIANFSPYIQGFLHSGSGDKVGAWSASGLTRYSSIEVWLILAPGRRHSLWRELFSSTTSALTSPLTNSHSVHK